ncbi:hypothetical protein L5515_010745 [Caenorhabditis briggsae]|uniref:Uncharacterized protein n=1 Tax=Caenorhabditis briggsae TaxID=6238 RepID=A0AAE9JG86_CAEBR|nr:hypothetical protein L5515_010745 [Caenorhabditis briggsae]
MHSSVHDAIGGAHSTCLDDRSECADAEGSPRRDVSKEMSMINNNSDEEVVKDVKSKPGKESSGRTRV